MEAWWFAYCDLQLFSLSLGPSAAGSGLAVRAREGFVGEACPDAH